MALTKQPLNINFIQGLDTKTDPFQVAPGKFLSLQNSIFDKAGRLTKRNGYGALTAIPSSVDSPTYITTYSNNLTAIGKTLQAYSADSATWINKGNLLPVKLSTLSLVKNSLSQKQADSVTAANGLTCVAYTSQDAANLVDNIYSYAIIDSVTGQYIVNPTQIASSNATYGYPRVFLLNEFFVIVYVDSVSNIRYFVINSTTPSIASVVQTAVTTTALSPHINFDGVVALDRLYLAYATSAGGNKIQVVYIDTSFSGATTPLTVASSAASIVTISVNDTASVLYVSYYDSGNAYTVGIYPTPTIVPAFSPPVQWLNGVTINNLTSTANSAGVTLYYEVVNAYSYDSTIGTNYIETNTVTAGGVVGTASTIVRSVGLASKAFTYNGVDYMLSFYQSQYEPSYFLINQSGQVVATLANSDGPSSYYANGLPNISIENDLVYISYLRRDLIQSISQTATTFTPSVYSQTGVNLVKFTLANNDVLSAEIGSNLNLTGGFLTAYDGVEPTEQGFFVYPENITAVYSTPAAPAGITTTAAVTNSNTIPLSNTTNVYVGMSVAGVGVPAATYITSINGLDITVNNLVTVGNGVALTIAYNVAAKPDSFTNTNAYFYQVTYEWTDNQGNLFRSAPSLPIAVTTTGAGTGIVTLNIPTLRLTYKTKNPVKIIVYRWSVNQQAYYQLYPPTYLINSSINDPTIDYVTIIDTQPDSNIVGNNLIYTTGGVVENIAAPATSNMCLFNNRLFLVDAEDGNLLWFSKQVLETTPVEMSDLLTIYVAPTTASQGSTGPITALSPMDDKLIIFKRNALGYINGNGPDSTGANSQYSEFTLINSVVGCINQRSIVFTPSGLMFQSAKGIWLLSRDLGTSYIGAPVESLTIGATVQSAVNVPGTTQVRFTLDSGITLMYDYYFQQWGTFTNIPAISSTIYANLHTYINSLGQVFQETPDQYLDNNSPVLMSFTTGWINLAGLQGFERFYTMFLLGQYFTPFKLNVQFAYDYNPSVSQAIIVTPNNYSPVYGGEALWGSGSVWGGTSKVFEARMFPQRQKCESFQITINELYDSSFGQVAGQGLTLSGMNLVIGVKKGYRTPPAKQNFG